MKKAIKLITASALSISVMLTPILASANDLENIEDVETVTPIVEAAPGEDGVPIDENQEEGSGIAGDGESSENMSLIESIKSNIKFIKTSEFTQGEFNPKTLKIDGLDSEDIKEFKVKVYSKLPDISYAYEGSDSVIPQEALNINTFSETLGEMIVYVDLEITMVDDSVETMTEVYSYNLVRDVSGFDVGDDNLLINPESMDLEIHESYKQNPDKYKILISYDGEVVKELGPDTEQFYLPDLIPNLTKGVYTVEVEFMGYDGILNKQMFDILVEEPSMSISMESETRLKLVISKAGVSQLKASFGSGGSTVSSTVNLTVQPGPGETEVAYINLPSFSGDRLYVTVEGVFKYGDADISVRTGYVHDKENTDFIIMATPSAGGNFEHSFDFTNSHGEDIRGRVTWDFFDADGKVVEVDKFSNLIYDFDYSGFEPGTYVFRATYNGTVKEFVTEVLGPKATIIKNSDGTLGVSGKYSDSQLEWRLTDGSPTVIYEQWISLDGPQKFLSQETIDRYSGSLVFEAIERAASGRESVARMEVISNGPSAPEHKDPEPIDPNNPVIPTDPDDPTNNTGGGNNNGGGNENETPQLNGENEVPVYDGNHPSTGDATQLVPYAIAMLGSGTLLFALNKRKRDE